MPTLADRISRRITARWWAGAIALGVLLLSGFVTGLAGDPARQAKPTDPLPIGSDSAAAAELRERLPATEGSTAVVLFSRTGAPLTDQDLAVVQERAAAAAGGAKLPLIPSSDRTAAIVVVPVDANNGPDAARLVTQLRDTVKADLPRASRHR